MNHSVSMVFNNIQKFTQFCHLFFLSVGFWKKGLGDEKQDGKIKFLTRFVDSFFFATEIKEKKTNTKDSQRWNLITKMHKNPKIA